MTLAHDTSSIVYLYLVVFKNLLIFILTGGALLLYHLHVYVIEFHIFYFSNMGLSTKKIIIFT